MQFTVLKEITSIFINEKSKTLESRRGCTQVYNTLQMAYVIMTGMQSPDIDEIAINISKEEVYGGSWSTSITVDELS